MARPLPVNYRPSRGSAQDDIQLLLDECDRMQRNWDLPNLGLPANGKTQNGRKRADLKTDSATGPKGNGQIRDMLSWALARHHALEEENKQSIGSESVETNAMADALQDAKDALADAKLRMRVAEASERAKIKEKLEKEMGQARRRSSAASAADSQKPTPRDEVVESEVHSEPPAAAASKLPESEAAGQKVEVKEGQEERRAIPLVPRPPSQDPAIVRPPRWKVVGGVGKGGIIVREKRDLQSQQFEERLSTGAVVEQTELVGDRLHYWRLSGSGPESGWVSLRMAQKDLLVLVKPPLRHWRSELTPVLRSSSAHSERPRPAMSLPRLPQPKSAPPPARMRQDHSLPPLPLNQDRAMYSMQSLQSVT